MKTTGRRRDRKFQRLGFTFLAAIGVSGCRSHSAASPAQQMAVQRVAQQSAEARVETDQEKSCREFVQGFYDWYTSPAQKDRDHPDGSRNWPDVLKMRKPDLSPELSRLLKADLTSKANEREGDLVGLEDDPFTNSQDNSPKFRVESAVIENGNCRSVVWGMDGGTHRETVEPEAMKADGKWRFINFHYRDDFENGKPSVDGDLISELKSFGY